MREAITFTAFFVNQAISSRTQALIADLQVIANMRAAAIVVQALIGACSGKKKRFTIFFWTYSIAQSADTLIKYTEVVINQTVVNERPLHSPHSLRGSSDQSLQSRCLSHTISMLIHSPLRHLNLVGPSQWVAVHETWKRDIQLYTQTTDFAVHLATSD